MAVIPLCCNARSMAWRNRRGSSGGAATATAGARKARIASSTSGAQRRISHEGLGSTLIELVLQALLHPAQRLSGGSEARSQCERCFVLVRGIGLVAHLFVDLP